MYMLERGRSQLFTQMQTTLKAPEHVQRFSNIQIEKNNFQCGQDESESMLNLSHIAIWFMFVNTVSHCGTFWSFNAWQGEMKTITQLLHTVNCIYSLHLVISRCSFTSHTTDREEEEEEEHCVSLPRKGECYKNCLLYVLFSVWIPPADLTVLWWSTLLTLCDIENLWKDISNSKGKKNKHTKQSRNIVNEHTQV